MTELFCGVCVATSMQGMAEPGVNAALEPLVVIYVLFKIVNDLA